MSTLKLSDFSDPEKEYQDVCAKLNRLSQQHEHVCAKNRKLAEENEKLRTKLRSFESTGINDQDIQTRSERSNKP